MCIVHVGTTCTWIMVQFVQRSAQPERIRGMHTISLVWCVVEIVTAFRGSVTARASTPTPLHSIQWVRDAAWLLSTPLTSLCMRLSNAHHSYSCPVCQYLLRLTCISVAM